MIEMQNQLFMTYAEIRKRLIRLFARHIGNENSVSINKILIKIYGDKVIRRWDFYQKIFYWEIIKKVLKELRGKGDLFTLSRGNRYFVLQTISEYSFFKTRTNKHIKSLNNLKVIAKEWVDKKKWRLI